jgi:serine/threonine-protein kinase RsbT
VDIRTSEQLGVARRLVSDRATDLAFTVIDRTQLVTAATELGRNVLVHGLGGTMRVDELLDNERSGLQLVFADNGRGIADIRQALIDGFSTGRSMGVGRGPAAWSTNSRSQAGPARGTTVTVIQWKRR